MRIMMMIILAWSRKASLNLNWTTDGRVDEQQQHLLLCCWFSNFGVEMGLWIALCSNQFNARISMFGKLGGSFTPYQFPTTYSESVGLRDSLLSDRFGVSVPWVKRGNLARNRTGIMPWASKWKMSRMLMGMQQFSSLGIMLIIPKQYFILYLLYCYLHLAHKMFFLKSIYWNWD